MLSGSSGNDTFTLSGGAGFAETINGAAGSDTLRGDNVANTWIVTGAGTGTLNSIPFADLENLTGGTAVDVFQMQPGAALGGTVNWSGRLGCSFFPESTLDAFRAVPGTEVERWVKKC